MRQGKLITLPFNFPRGIKTCCRYDRRRNWVSFEASFEKKKKEKNGEKTHHIRLGSDSLFSLHSIMFNHRFNDFNQHDRNIFSSTISTYKDINFFRLGCASSKLNFRNDFNKFTRLFFFERMSPLSLARILKLKLLNCRRDSRSNPLRWDSKFILNRRKDKVVW